MLLLALAASLIAIDGDTIRQGKERLRLVGIDAPEIHGCRKGRICVKGDGHASKRNLARLIVGPVRIDRIGKDRYGRSLSHVYAGRVNVACAQIRAGQAVYVAKWDNHGRLARECISTR